MKYHYYDRSTTEMKVKNRKIVILSTFWKLNSYFLKNKIQFCIRSLKINKTIDSLLETNKGLFKSISGPSSLPIQDSTSADSKISNSIHEIHETISRYNSKQITVITKLNPKSVQTKNSLIIVGNSIFKHLIAFGNPKKNHVKIKTSPGATTEDIIGYIKPNI